MSVLLAIGRFFKKIWDWIKQTAWIQPLLIVGIIFGIIFSIRPIVEAAGKSRREKGEFNKFYNNYSLSLSGESANNLSEAGVFTNSLYKLAMGDINAEQFKNECGTSVENKFFMAFVANSCSHCEEYKDGFVTFKNKLNNAAEYYTNDRNEKFDLVTIFADEGKYSDTKEEDSLFFEYCNNHQQFLTLAAGVAQESYYKMHDKISDQDINDLYSGVCADFPTPTILLIELDEPEVITEVMFGVEGSDKNDRAKTLYNCWEHKGKFSESGN